MWLREGERNQKASPRFQFRSYLESNFKDERSACQVQEAIVRMVQCLCMALRGRNEIRPRATILREQRLRFARTLVCQMALCRFFLALSVRALWACLPAICPSVPQVCHIDLGVLTPEVLLSGVRPSCLSHLSDSKCRQLMAACMYVCTMWAMSAACNVISCLVCIQRLCFVHTSTATIVADFICSSMKNHELRLASADSSGQWSSAGRVASMTRHGRPGFRLPWQWVTRFCAGSGHLTE